jgi:hypothetical protein
MIVDLLLLADQGRKAHWQRTSGMGVTVRRRPALDVTAQRDCARSSRSGPPPTPYSSRQGCATQGTQPSTCSTVLATPLPGGAAALQAHRFSVHGGDRVSDVLSG